MKKYLLSACLFLAGFPIPAQIVEWIHSYETVTSAAHGIAYDDEASLYFTGYIRWNGNAFDGLPQNYSYGYEDGLICKADTQGHLRWMKVLGAYSSEKAKFIHLQDDKLTVGGDITNWGGSSSLHIDSLAFQIPTTGPIYAGYVVQLDTAGHLQWLVFLPGRISSMKTDDDGNTYATCGFNDSYLYKISPSGSVIYGFIYSPISSYNCELAFDADGNVYGAVNFSDTIWFMGNLYQSHGGSDILWFKVSQTGSILNSAVIGSTGSDFVNGLLADHAGNILMTGGWSDTVYFPNTVVNGSGSRYFIARLDTAGNLIQSSDQDFLYPENNAVSWAGSLVENSNREIVTAINFMDTLIHGNDTISTHNFGGYDGAGVLAKWDSSLQLKWYRRLAHSTQAHNTGHVSVFLSKAVADKIYICGQMNEHVIIEGMDYNINGYYVAYTGLFRDTTFDFTAQTPVPDDPPSGFTIYPNPSSGQVDIRLHSRKKNNSVLVNLYAPDGRKVYSKTLSDSWKVLDMSLLPRGIYFIQVISEGFTGIQKMMKE